MEVRQIKFRGKRVDNGEWIYGYYFKYNDTHNVVPGEYSSKPISHFYIDPKTLGQFTGLTDKNGKDIYEGDKVKCGNGYIDNVYFDEKDCSFGVEGYYNSSQDDPSMPFSENEVFEVIGTIHD